MAHSWPAYPCAYVNWKEFWTPSKMPNHNFFRWRISSLNNNNIYCTRRWFYISWVFTRGNGLNDFSSPSLRQYLCWLVLMVFMIFHDKPCTDHEHAKLLILTRNPLRTTTSATPINTIVASLVIQSISHVDLPLSVTSSKMLASTKYIWFQTYRIYWTLDHNCQWTRCACVRLIAFLLLNKCYWSKVHIHVDAAKAGRHVAS